MTEAFRSWRQTMSRKLTNITVLVVAFLLSVKFIKGAPLKLTMSGSSSRADIGKSYTLTCTVTGAANLDDVVKIKRGSEDVGSFAQSKMNCSAVSTMPGGYNISCGAGTSDAKSDTKVYTVVIEKVTKYDYVNWSCGLNIDYSKKFILSFAKTCSLTCEHGGTLKKDTCTCDCRGNWEGDTCERCIFKCKHGGNLRDNTCMCQCRGNWEGDTCEICRIMCKHSGIVKSDACMCQCPRYWKGDKCEICGLKCNNGDIDKDNCTCVCHNNWRGVKCDFAGGNPERMVDSLGVGIIVVILIAVLLAVAIPLFLLNKRRKAIVKGDNEKLKDVKEEILKKETSFDKTETSQEFLKTMEC